MTDAARAERLAQTALRSLRAEASGLAAQWVRPQNGGGPTDAAAETCRSGAEALIVLLLDAADAEASPAPAQVTRQLGRLAAIGGSAASDPYVLIEELDRLCELMHESLHRQINALDDASADAALLATRRLARAQRGMIAAVSLLPDRPPVRVARARQANSGETGAADASTNDIAAFVRRLAHDLKNPLGTAKGAAETLIDASALENAEQRHQFAEIVVRSLDRAVQLIDEARRNSRQDG